MPVPEASYAVVVGPPLAAGAEEVPVARHAGEEGVLHKACLNHVKDVWQQRHLQESNKRREGSSRAWLTARWAAAACVKVLWIGLCRRPHVMV
jgi:hypothetical protein